MKLDGGSFMALYDLSGGFEKGKIFRQVGRKLFPVSGLTFTGQTNYKPI